MNHSTKQEIQLLLRTFLEQHPSQAKAVAKLNGVSEATVIAIKNEKWENISNEMWRTVGKQVGWTATGSWNIVETLDFNTLFTIFGDGKDYSNVFAIVGPAGSGKTFAANFFAKHRPNVFNITCCEFFNRKMFLAELVTKMGKDASGLNVRELMNLIVETAMKLDTPLFIFDEVDKLNDQVFCFIITLYNMLKGKAGLILMATEHLSKRIKRGLNLNKKGYAEIYSRIGRRFITLHGSNKEEIKAICEANGVDDPIAITEIYNDYEGDLRRVEKLIHKERILASKKKAA